ncbi:MAG: RNA methyltransferase, partial [Terriglobales bacterium]
MRIVLVRTRNPLNMGAAARAMANFGFDDLVLVAPYVEGWQRARSARAGSAVLLRARVAADLTTALEGCSFVVGTAGGEGRAPEVPLEDWHIVASQFPSTGVALVFGSEKTGLSVDDISHCHRLARLPTRPQAPSMNLGQAVAVCCFDLGRRAASSAQAPISPPAVPLSAPKLERILEAWYP